MKTGTKAPDFKLKDKDGIEHRLSTIEAPHICLFFYPKDNTPGCTIEAQEFSAHSAKFSKNGCAVIGISGGDEKSKAAFCKKNKLSVLLLSDPKFETAKAYDTFGEKKFMGRTYNGIFRKTFVLRNDRTVLKVFDEVKPAGHAEEVLAFLATVGGEKPKSKAQAKPKATGQATAKATVKGKKAPAEKRRTTKK